MAKGTAIERRGPEMSTYSTSLQIALDNIFYRDRSRISLKSSDKDVLEIFSGDEKAVIFAAARIPFIVGFFLVMEKNSQKRCSFLAVR
jgi:mRNA deadenylase 3'-5' endonuclease subunit Ccr4